MVSVVDLDEMRALARAVALDADLDLEIGLPGSGWHIKPDIGRINADGGDCARGPADDIRGLVCHEAAHAAVTRYLHIIPREILKTTGMSSLMNSLEDCRIEDWLAARFPGTEPWIQLYNDRLFPERSEFANLPWMSQFCLGLIYEWWYGALPETLHAEVVAALATTSSARARYFGLQPPTGADVDLDQAAAYHASRVSERFREEDRFAPPDGFEKVVRRLAWDAWRVAWTEIRPVYLDLIARDVEHAAQMKEAEARLLRRLNELRNGAPMGRRRRPSEAVPTGASVTTAPEAHPGGTSLEDLPEEMRAAMDRIVNAPPEDLYAEARRDVAGLADRMFAELERILRPNSYPRWVRGFPSGSRVDLRTAMALDVEPGAYLRMWDRKTLPKKRDPSFLLLLDLSGSMQGERIEAAFRAMVLMAEVLERLAVPFAVWGFQDVPIVGKQFAEPLDAAMRTRLGGLPAESAGRRPGGRNHPEHNWDAPVLEKAADALLQRPTGHRVLIVVSDGEPSGPGADAESALRSAVRRVTNTGLTLIGIGIGPGTEHVARYYPSHLASVPLNALPTALGRIIAAEIT